MTEDTEENHYASHQKLILAARPSPERITGLESALLSAYKRVITYREVPFIQFGELNAEELALAFIQYPVIVKPTLCCVNIAQRAIKQDLGFDFDTYSGNKLPETQALMLAAYIKPLLPPAMAVPALMELDRFFWTDKEMRSSKGNWEKTVTLAISALSSKNFKKRKFIYDKQNYEIDAAFPASGQSIEIAIDVKRIQSTRDIHKRSDEIINKAQKFKKAYPEGKFFAVVYYPFPTQHMNLRSRLNHPDIDDIFFAGDTASSIEAAADMLVGRLGLKKKD